MGMVGLHKACPSALPRGAKLNRAAAVANPDGARSIVQRDTLAVLS
jgi:hypothetical protein